MAVSANCGTVLIADENASSRNELARLFEAAGYEVVQADSGEAALEAAKDVTPSVALLEIPLGSLSGYEVCRVLREQPNGIPIVFVSGTRTESYDRVAGLLLGADDYVVKPYAPDELLTRVRNLVRRKYPDASIAAAAAKLTRREREVLELLSQGLPKDEIAERLVVSRKTVGSHVENILRKLGVRSQTQAVALAYRENLLNEIP